ncbi:MAG: hypothetical protein Q7W02_12845 [Candidatus Rokubacteria bacterium]|nr:hypothetical protein [Candidatus Rokubacteria bacterium]
MRSSAEAGRGRAAPSGAELREAVALAPNLPQRAEIDQLPDELPR